MIKAGNTAWLLGLLLGVVVAPVLADAHGQGLSRGEYERWHDVFAGSVSPDGKYFSYTLRYPGAQPKQATTEHVVVDIETGHEVVKVPGSVVPESSYSPDGRWYAMPGADGTRLVDLVSADTKVFQGHSRFGFAGQGKYFIVLERGSDPDAAAGKLSVVGLKGDAGFEMPEVGSFVISEDGETLGVVQRSAESWVLKIVELGAQAGEGEVLLASAANLQLLAIGDQRSYVLAQEAPGKDPQAVRPVTHYFERGDGGSVYRHYHHEHGSSGGEVSGVREHKWHASKQGAFILFSESSRHEQQVAAGTGDAELVASVQVWNSMDARVVTDRKRGRETRRIAWWPRSGTLVDVTSGGATIQLVTGDGRYALTRSGSLDIRTSYDDLSGMHELVDLASGSRTVLFQGGEGRAVQAISSSPCGRYLAYVADSRWWIHDIDGGSRQDVSDLVATPLLVEDWDMAGHVPPYGSPGWTVDNQLVIYDRYDAWLVSPEDKRARKITDGRATSRVYRVDHAANGVGLRAAVFDVSDGIVFSVVNEATKHSGYSVYRQDAGLTGLVYEDARIQRVLPRRDLGFVHMRERFDTPPELRVVDSLGKAERTLFRSNTHHAELDRGRTKLIEYTGKSGRRLQGILLYPDGYDEDKSYPMIVSIYQRQSHLLHEYRMPSRSRYMPHANYTGDGYFVLLPDIEYGPGGPGDWALKSVTAAVEAALDVGRIDRHAIGLTGASWGGYQTLYIAGTSDLFATAIAGSAPSDLVSSYLSVESDLGIPTSWRYEMQQLRMHAPLHEGYGAYVENSPIFRANGISIPILSWHGENDGSIGLSQALEMHLLLRRMKRQHVLLVYPGEPHVIVDDENAIDLNARMKQWFEHYLKGAKAPNWMLHSYSQGDSAGDLAR